MRTAIPKSVVVCLTCFTGLCLSVALAFLAGYGLRPSAANSFQLPETLLHADAATQNDAFAMAVGPVDNEVEALYILDFLTGELTCTVLNYQNGKFNAIFKANVIQDLGIVQAQAKRPKYLMASGQVNFRRGSTTARPGHSAIYVLDTTSGTFAAYGVPWRREFASTGAAQAGPLRLLDVGKARTAAIRD